jgi:hypothetical protein
MTEPPRMTVSSARTPARPEAAQAPCACRACVPRWRPGPAWSLSGQATRNPRWRCAGSPGCVRRCDVASCFRARRVARLRGGAQIVLAVLAANRFATSARRFTAAQLDCSSMHNEADTCVPHVGPVATVRDGRRRAASAGRSRHSEHPGAGVSVAETLIGRACQQPRFAVSIGRHSRRMTRVTGWPGSGRRLAGSSVAAGPGAGMFASCRFPASMRSVA